MFVLSDVTPTLTAEQVNALGTGTWNVSLTVTDSFGATNTGATTLTISINLPVAVIDASTDTAEAGQDIVFDATGSYHTHAQHTIITYEWDFGDGGTASGAVVSHSYAGPGTYTVILTVTDDNVPALQDTDSIDIVIYRNNLLPVADAGGPYIGMAKTPVAFDGSGSTDQDGSIVLYEWDFDSDGSYDYSSPSPAASFTWETAYAGPVTLRVTDNEGATDTDIADVTVTMPVSLADLRSVQYRFGSPAPGYTYAYWPIFEYWQQVRFKNFGEGKAYNVTATIASVPVNTTILDGTVSLGDIEAGASAWSKDTFKMRIDMANPQGPNECYWWRVEYDDEFGNHHVIENVRQLPL
jgi:PKD repeat protein